MQKDYNKGKTMTKEEEHYLVYEHLLAMAKELELDHTLDRFSKSIYKDIEDFEENYPEVVSEYLFINKEK